MNIIIVQEYYTVHYKYLEKYLYKYCKCQYISQYICKCRYIQPCLWDVGYLHTHLTQCCSSEVTFPDTSGPLVFCCNRSLSLQHRHSSSVGIGSQHPQEHHQFPEISVLFASSPCCSSLCLLVLSSICMSYSSVHSGSDKFYWFLKPSLFPTCKFMLMEPRLKNAKIAL